MENQKNGLSVARIIDREKYYKNKALHLEQELIFSNEKISVLEQQIATLENEVAEDNNKQQQTEQQLKELETRYEELTTRYNEDIENYKKLEQDLNSELTELRKNQRDTNDVDAEAYNKKIKSYERLLAEIQVDLTDKDKEIDVYKKRLSIMEKRLKRQGDMELQQRPDVNKQQDLPTPELRALPYWDYAIIFGDKRSVVRGELIIENIGKKPLDTPYICLRFTPGDAAEIKGKIISWSSVENETLDQDGWQWAFLDNEWAEEARERGEIWVYPTQSLTITPGDRVILSDLQIPIEQKYFDHVSVETFIYFQKSDYRVKSANQILINF